MDTMGKGEEALTKGYLAVAATHCSAELCPFSLAVTEHWPIW